MNITESIRDWVQATVDTELSAVEVVTMGEAADLDPPFLGIYETAAEIHETEGVIVPGVTDYQVTVELHTVPAADGTSNTDAMDWRRRFHDIIADRDAIDYVTGREWWKVFDIRVSGPTTEAIEGRRVSRWELEVVAAPTT